MKFLVGPLYLTVKISGGQQELGHGVVHHIQGEHNLSYFITIYQEDLIHAFGLALSTPGLV